VAALAGFFLYVLMLICLFEAMSRQNIQLFERQYFKIGTFTGL
jgi:hypothetical protein